MRASRLNARTVLLLLAEATVIFGAIIGAVDLRFGLDGAHHATRRARDAGRRARRQWRRRVLPHRGGGRQKRGGSNTHKLLRALFTLRQAQ